MNRWVCEFGATAQCDAVGRVLESPSKTEVLMGVRRTAGTSSGVERAQRGTQEEATVNRQERLSFTLTERLLTERVSNFTKCYDNGKSSYVSAW